MTFRGYREISRIDWGSNDERISPEQINTGALLRIADATELIAKRYQSLIDDRDYWERRAKDAEMQMRTELHRTAALRGYIKRLKMERKA